MHILRYEWGCWQFAPRLALHNYAQQKTQQREFTVGHAAVSPEQVSPHHAIIIESSYDLGQAQAMTLVSPS